MEGFGRLQKFEYSPWLTANLTIDRPPRGAGTDERAWDNVVAHSPTLGYVDATHQTLRSHVDRTVWTFYWALAEGSPAANRALLLQKDWRYWSEAILSDLERVHPDIRSCVSRIDIMRIGHAMARPVVGSIFDPQRRELAQGRSRLVFANSDLSGFSIFEEAQYRGVEAADASGRTAVRRRISQLSTSGVRARGSLQDVWRQFGLGEHAVKMRKGFVAFSGRPFIEILEQLQHEVDLRVQVGRPQLVQILFGQIVCR
jgi:hypothetical protein